MKEGRRRLLEMVRIEHFNEVLSNAKNLLCGFLYTYVFLNDILIFFMKIVNLEHGYLKCLH